MSNLAQSTRGRQGRPWIPLPEAARRLGLRYDSVVQLIKRGHLVGHLVRPRWFVRADSLANYRRWTQRAA